MTGNAMMSKTIKAWKSSLQKNLKNISPEPEVTIGTFQDAKKLFGDKFDTKVTLRKAGHHEAQEDIVTNVTSGKAENCITHKKIVLVQFDPNFKSIDVICRHPSCHFKNPSEATGGKRDLYLCPKHRQVLKNWISDALAQKNISIATSEEKPEPGRFDGYISLIGLLEGAYHDAMKFQTLQGKSPMVLEAILNVRNFLIITSTVLNPDVDNLEIVLPPVVRILQLILENADNVPPLLNGLMYVLREVTEMILFAFGVVYTWVSLAFQSPGAQIGAGVGGVIGAISLVLVPLSGITGVITGAVLGGLIGNGIYSLMEEHQKRQSVERLILRTLADTGGTAAGPEQSNNSRLVYSGEGDAFGELHLQLY